MKKIGLYSAISILNLFLLSASVSAHPGNTASDGCHYCRTNCASWGVPSNTRHCHGSNTKPLSKTPYNQKGLSEMKGLNGLKGLKGQKGIKGQKGL